MVRLAGHALTVEFSGERSRDERSSTGFCRCGWSESASVQDEVRFEYRMHLRDQIERIERNNQSAASFGARLGAGADETEKS